MRYSAATLLAFATTASATELVTKIRDHCSAEWPGDYRMQEYCHKRQIEGMAYSQEFFKKHGISSADYEEKLLAGSVPEVIWFTCVKEWPDDHSMRAYCLRRQEESAKRIGTLE